MAHECPVCYTTCHCNGDIDDVCLEPPEYFFCTHCDESEFDGIDLTPEEIDQLNEEAEDALSREEHERDL